MNVTFTESGMTFEFDAANLFRIEKSPVAVALQGLKHCECIVSTPTKTLDFIEAKTDIPNPNNKENEEGIRQFYAEIEQKFTDSLLYMIGLAVKRRKDPQCPENVAKASLDSVTRCRLLLIVKKLQDKFLPETQDLFKKELKHIMHAWNINDFDVKVMNEDIAKSKRIVH